MGEPMKYEQAMWALARALYEMKRAAENGPWGDASSVEHANWRAKASQCLTGWGFDNFEGRLDGRVAPPSEFHAASRAAQEQYLRSLCAKYGEFVPRPSFASAVAALAEFASDVAWDKLSEIERAARINQTAGMLAARGFKGRDGSIQLEDEGGTFFNNVATVLHDKFAFKRVEALARGDTKALMAIGLGGRAREIRSKRAFETFGREILTTDKTEAGVRSAHLPVVERIEQHMGEADTVQPGEHAYPTGPGGAEDYRAVQAPVGVLASAVDVIARDLYEKAVAQYTDAKHWTELNNEGQRHYRAQAEQLPLDLVNLARTFRGQRAADRSAGRKEPETPFFSESKAERIETAAGMWVDGKLSDNGAKAVGVTVSDVEQTLRQRDQAKTASKTDPDVESVQIGRFAKLGAIAYATFLAVHPGMRPWDRLTSTEQNRIVDIAKASWYGNLIATDGQFEDYLCGAVRAMRSIAKQDGLTLGQFVSSARSNEILSPRSREMLAAETGSPEYIRITGLNDQEAEALAWFGYESVRDLIAQDPIVGYLGSSWADSEAVERKQLVDAGTRYLTTGVRSTEGFANGMALLFYTALSRLRRFTDKAALTRCIAGICDAYRRLGHVSSNVQIRFV